MLLGTRVSGLVIICCKDVITDFKRIWYINGSASRWAWTQLINLCSVASGIIHYYMLYAIFIQTALQCTDTLYLCYSV